MNVLILCPFAEREAVRLKEHGSITIESWFDTQQIQDPERLGVRLRREGYDSVIVEADFLFAETFNAAPNLLYAGVCRADAHHVDIAAATECGVAVVNTPGRNANAVAELVFGLMISVSRKIAHSDHWLRDGSWSSPIAAYTQLQGFELQGKTLGIIGLGSIGRAVATIARGFGMHVLAYDPVVTPSDADRFGATWCDIDMLVEASDFVTLHCPPTKDGTPLLDQDRLSRIKNGSVLINTAAPSLLDEDALVDAIEQGRIRGAGIDVFQSHPIDPNSPLLKLENVTLTPHIGGATFETIDRHSAMMTDDLIRFHNGEMPERILNPEVWERRRGI